MRPEPLDKLGTALLEGGGLRQDQPAYPLPDAVAFTCLARVSADCESESTDSDSMANRASALGNEGPIGRFVAVLKAATADERRRIKDGLALLVRFADTAG